MPPRLVLAAALVVVFRALPAVATPIPVSEVYGLALHAEANTWTCPFSWCVPPVHALPQVTMDAVLTVVDVIDAVFPDTVSRYPDHTKGTLVLDITGTLTVDCTGASVIYCWKGETFDGTYDVSFAPNTSGDGSNFGGGPMFVTFALTGGLGGVLWNDHAATYLYGPGLLQVPMSIGLTRVDAPASQAATFSVPDASSSLLLFVLTMIGVLRWHHHAPPCSGCGYVSGV